MVPRKHHPHFQVPTKDYFEGYLESQQPTKANAVPCSPDEDDFDEGTDYPESSPFCEDSTNAAYFEPYPSYEGSPNAEFKDKAYAQSLFYEGRSSFAGVSKWVHGPGAHSSTWTPSLVGRVF